MKKLFFSILLSLFACNSVQAAGPYDGIYKVYGTPMHMTVNQNGSTVILVFLDSAVGDWEAYQGAISNGKSTVKMIANSDGPVGNVSLEVTFNDDNTADMNLLTCTSEGGTCSYEPGDDFGAKKIF